MNKLLIVSILIYFPLNLFAQKTLPTQLQGTWKMEGQEIYEHWDVLSEEQMKGFSYKWHEGAIKISEYLDLQIINSQVVYTATVIGQNKGNGIPFTLTKTDTSLIFENPQHDFPKKIEYQLLSENEILVMVSDGGKKGFAYKLIKQDMTPNENNTNNTNNPNYDSALAEKLGADEYGMKTYVLAILKTGKNTGTDQEYRNRAFRGHLDNINRLVLENLLVVAGPMGNNENTYRGIYIFSVTTLEEAEILLQTDPAIDAGFLEADLYIWYGSAALPEYLKASDKIWKTKP